MHDFSDVVAQLQVLVNVNGFYKSNRFCVAGFKVDTYEAAEVYWPIEHKFILWEPGDAPDEFLMSRRYLDTRQDVVPSEDDLHGSTYLWTVAELNEYIKECYKYGNIYTIIKSYDGWVSDPETLYRMKKQLQILVDAQASEKNNEFCRQPERQEFFWNICVLENSKQVIAVYT